MSRPSLLLLSAVNWSSTPLSKMLLSGATLIVAEVKLILSLVSTVAQILPYDHSAVITHGEEFDSNLILDALSLDLSTKSLPNSASSTEPHLKVSCVTQTYRPTTERILNAHPLSFMAGAVTEAMCTGDSSIQFHCLNGTLMHSMTSVLDL